MLLFTECCTCKETDTSIITETAWYSLIANSSQWHDMVNPHENMCMRLTTQYQAYMRACVCRVQPSIKLTWEHVYAAYNPVSSLHENMCTRRTAQYQAYTRTCVCGVQPSIKLTREHVYATYNPVSSLHENMCMRRTTQYQAYICYHSVKHLYNFCQRK